MSEIETETTVRTQSETVGSAALPDGVEAPSGSTEAQTTEVDTPVTPEQNQGLVEARDRYRTERDSAREALTAAQDRIAQFQRTEVERLAAESLAIPGDLFTLSGNEIGDYLTEDGDVDADKVAADVAAILAERPGLEKRQTPLGYDPSAGTGGGPPKPALSWSDLLKF